MILFRQLLLVFAFLAPLSAAALDVNDASCEQLSTLSQEEKRTIFSSLQYTQSPSVLSFIIGPQCSFLGEIQILAYINDPQLTIQATPEVLYYSPTLDMLFVSYQEKNTIAYAIPHEGRAEPLDFFIAQRSQAVLYADAAKRFALFAQELQSSSRSTFSSSQTSSITPRNNTIVSPPVPRMAVNTSAPSLSSSTVASIPSITPEQPNIPDTPPKGTGISIWQVVIVMGTVALLIFIYTRRRNSLPI